MHLLVAPLTAKPMMWREEHLCNFSTLENYNFIIVIIVVIVLISFTFSKLQYFYIPCMLTVVPVPNTMPVTEVTDLSTRHR
jgi:hypothetical protein